MTQVTHLISEVLVGANAYQTHHALLKASYQNLVETGITKLAKALNASSVPLNFRS